MREGHHTLYQLKSSRLSAMKRNWLRIGLLICMVLLTAYLFSLRGDVAGLERYGYPGILVLNLLASGTILMPAPGAMSTFAFGGVFHPMWVGVWAGVGAALGELSGYAAGFSGRAVVENNGVYEKVVARLERHKGKIGVVLFMAAAVPNPLFDVVGIAAGVLRIRIARFLVAVILGNIVKMLLFAYAGSILRDWFGK